jgi:hypothetical protein
MQHESLFLMMLPADAPNVAMTGDNGIRSIVAGMLKML